MKDKTKEVNETGHKRERGREGEKEVINDSGFERILNKRKGQKIRREDC